MITNNNLIKTAVSLLRTYSYNINKKIDNIEV